MLTAEAYMNKKQRFVKGMSKSPQLPGAVWINKPVIEGDSVVEIPENRESNSLQKLSQNH